MKRKPIIIALTLLLVFGTAFAQMRGKDDKTQPKQGLKGENCQILTDDERQKVADSKRAFEKVAIPLRADVQVLRMELDDLLIAGKSGKDLTDKLDELNAAKAKLSEERLKHQVDVRKIVGEDKYKQMQMFRQHMMHNKMQGKFDGKQGGKMKGGKMNSQPRYGDCPYGNEPRYK